MVKEKIIYALKNKVNGRLYIGQTTNLNNRKKCGNPCSEKKKNYLRKLFSGKTRENHSKFMKKLWKDKNSNYNKIDWKKSKNPKKKKIRCLETGNLYISIGDASRELNLLRQSISKVLRGIIKTTGGYSFVYVMKEKK